MAQNLQIRTRNAERSKTLIFATLRYYKQTAEGRVIDLSASGMALELRAPFHAAAGSRIRIESEDLGFLEGTVMWNRSGRLGVRLQLSTNSLAQVSSYFRFFHEEPKSTFRAG